MKAPLLASIDIGSNSVLLLVGRVINGKLHTELQRKETIRLGGALDSERNLEPSAMERGLECLRRYATLIAHISPAHRRVVATQTLREARNRDTFLQQAQAILGCPVELISGEREAALIYQGVSSLLPASPERRLVIDIGGRSTEICLGQGSHLEKAISCPIGSVACAQRFFGDGVLHADRFAAAHAHAHALLQTYMADWNNATWEQVLGSSGTAGAISKALHQAGYPAGEITRPTLFQLQQQLIFAGHIDRLALQGLREELRPVIAGGVSVMCAVFDTFQLQHMHIAQGALRHGVLFDLQQSLQSGAAPAA
ncbi:MULTISPECIES: Ppx/GppA family phosphatase [Comamonas]|uniref:Ppx/GppA family phosphatase n=1 Tax=Comamonas TaxID=283 RepID=UPI00257A38AD|nr:MULTISPECIES: Ppx/GppA family phosphatase [Comamonas]